MAIISCTRCGAETEHTAKFCRKCGNPVNLSEATTRNLEATTEDELRTRHVNVAPTSPSYLAPGPFPPMSAPSTQNLGKSSHKVAIIGLASLVVILLVALAAVLLIRVSNEYAPEAPPAIGGHPPLPDLPPLPPQPPQPPLPPVPGAEGQATGTDLIYPGAAKENEFNAGPGGVVIKLQTSDPVRKVVDWYEARLKNNKVIRIQNGTSVITSGATAVVVKPENGGTSIVITRAGIQ